MVRNIDLLNMMQEAIHKIYFLSDEIALTCEMEKISVSDLIDNNCKHIKDILSNIDDIDRLLGSVTEDLRDSMLNEGFDSDEYKVWNAGLRLNNLRLENMMESIIDAVRVLELYILETIRGYKILTQLAYDMNPRLPGFKQQAKSN